MGLERFEVLITLLRSLKTAFLWNEEKRAAEVALLYEEALKKGRSFNLSLYRFLYRLPKRELEEIKKAVQVSLMVESLIRRCKYSPELRRIMENS